jgi:hypothetical protein
MQARVSAGDVMHPCATNFRFSTVHGQVLEQWPKMFEILNLFREFTFSCISLRSDQPNPVRDQSTTREDTFNVPPSISEGELLVRIPIDELQAATAERGAR